MTVWVPDRKFS